MADMLKDVPIPGVAIPESLDFETFFRGEFPKLCGALVLLVGDAFEAEELAQESMTRVLERWDRVREMDSPTGYLFRTALNLQRKRIVVSRSAHGTSSPTCRVATRRRPLTIGTTSVGH